MAQTSPHTLLRKSRYRYPLFVMGLMLLGVLAISFPLAIIQIQSGVTAYLAGESNWSRGELEAVRLAHTYANSGQAADLENARKWLDIPLGDLAARKALEQEPVDTSAAREGFLRGQNHPRDIPKMIWLFRLASDAPYVEDAIKAWRASDPHILALKSILDELENAWQDHKNGQPKLQQLRHRLEIVNTRLAHHAESFRRNMSRASRALVTILSVTSVVFFVLLGGLVFFMIHRLTQAIRQSEFKFRSTFERAAIGILQLDEEGVMTAANQAACQILALKPREFRQQRFDDLIHADYRKKNREQAQKLKAGEIASHTTEQQLHAGDGSLIWARVTMSLFTGQFKQPPQYVVILEDVSEARRLNEKLNYQASHDELTGLINRRAFMIYLEEALKLARNEHFVHALCFIDLDRFKIVNDTKGHQVGDQVLRQVADEITRHLRKGDLFARLGGDEFGLILECCDPQQAMTIAGTIRNTLIETPFYWEDQSFNIGCSIGVAPITSSSASTAELLQAADSACNLAKEQGRSRVLLAQEDDQQLAERRTQMEWLDRIRAAVREDRLTLFAQRIYPINSHPALSYEILVRMQGPDGVQIPPNAFIPAAERYGIADLIDRWVIKNTLEQISRHAAHQQAMHCCHINVSGSSFDAEGFTEFIESCFRKHPRTAGKICFEITETAAIRNLADVRAFMNRLSHFGCHFALDDFGAGLSSFTYLKQLPVNYLKIDGAFVRDIARDKTDRAMVNAINEIAHTLDKKTVAEFVEDQEGYAVLAALGVDYAQGFHLHRPAPLETMFSVTL